MKEAGAHKTYVLCVEYVDEMGRWASTSDNGVEVSTRPGSLQSLKRVSGYSGAVHGLYSVECDFGKGDDMKFLLLGAGAIMLSGCASLVEVLTTEPPPDPVPETVGIICSDSDACTTIDWTSVDLCYGQAVRRAESYRDPLEAMSSSNNSLPDRSFSRIRERERVNQEKAERADDYFEECLVENGYEIAACGDSNAECRMEPSASFLPREEG